MEMEEEKEIILKNLGDCVKKVYGEWCSSPCRSVGCKNVRGVVAGVDDALGHGLRRPADGYWPLLSTLLDQDTRSHLLLYQCPKARGWQWVVRSLAQGELESLVTVVLAHLHLLPPLYRPHALLLDASAQLVLPTLLAGLEHVKLSQSTELQLGYQPPFEPSASLQQESPPRNLAISSFRSLRASFLPASRRSSAKLQQQSSSPSTTHRVLPHHHSGECTTSPSSPGRRTPVAPTAPSPQFLFNVPQGQFPSLEPHGAYSSITTSGGQMVFPQPQYATDHFTVGLDGMLGLDYSFDEDPPIDTCREATEELNEQLLNAEEEAEMTVQVHHFGKQKKRSRDRSSASVTTSSVSTPFGSAIGTVSGSLKEKEDEAEAQEMSLEDELRAATHGDFVENRPPLGLGTDPDLIVGILNDDKLVKVLPDVSMRGHAADALELEACDEFSTDDMEVEIVEVFADRLIRREDLHKLASSDQRHRSSIVGQDMVAAAEQNDSHNNSLRGSLPSGVVSKEGSEPNVPPLAVARSLETTSSLIKPETLKKSSSNSTPSRTPKAESKHLSRVPSTLDQASPLSPSFDGDSDGGGQRQRHDNKMLEKQRSVTGLGKSKNDKQDEPRAGARNSQQQLLEARQLLRSLTDSGVIDDSPELGKLLESLEQREAMLWERSPPEGQEDPPGVQGGSSNSLKKLSRQRGSKAAKATTGDSALTEEGDGKKQDKCDAGSKDALDPTEGGIALRRNTYTKTESPKQKEVPCSNASSVSPAVYSQYGQSGSETCKSEKAIADDTAEANTRAYATSCDEQDTLASDDDQVLRNEDRAVGPEEEDYDSDDIPESSHLDVDESFAETDQNVEEEEEVESQLMTDADPSEARDVMSCSSTSSEDSEAMVDDGGGDTDVDQSREAIDGCYSTDDDGPVYLCPRVHGDRSAGVGLDTDDTFSSDDESSVGPDGEAVGSEDSGTEEECGVETGSVQQLVDASYHRQPVAMDESMCSLDETNTDEALTEGCREKTGIMGGTKWEELMGAGASIKLGTPAKIVHLVSETNTPRICDEDHAKIEIVKYKNSVSNCSISKSISATSVTHAPVVNSLSLGANVYATNVSVPFVSSVSASNLFSVESNLPSNLANGEPLIPVGTDFGLNNISKTEYLESSTISNGSDVNNQPASSTLAETSEDLIKPDIDPMTHSKAFLEEGKNMTDATIANLKAMEAEANDKYATGTGMTRTLSLSSCGSKSGVFECSSRYDTRSDGKLSAILDTKLDCRLDSTSESVVAALDDAAREAQLQLLHLHTQLMVYKRMAARKKARKVIDVKMNPVIKQTMLALKIPVRLTSHVLKPQLYPLKHEEALLPGCEECEELIKLEESYLEEFTAKMSLTVSEAAQNVLTTAIFRRPGEKLCKVFMMREGHTRGVAYPVRVVLSTHALYVLNTCPAPSLQHALPYTQLHTAVLGACRDWVVVLSRGAVESGGELRGHVGREEAAADDSTPSSTVGGEVETSPYAVGIQLCSADPDLTVEFVASLELQTRRSLMSALANEMRVAGGEERFMPPPTLSSHNEINDKVSDQLCLGLTLTDSLSELPTQLPSSAAPSGSRSSRVSTPQEGTPSWRRVTSSAGRGLKPQHFGLSDCIEALVPSVVDASDWENKVLAQWLAHLLPPELQVCCPVLGSWLVDWDGGVRLGQSGALGPTLEGPLLFRTTKLFSSWRQAHFLLKAGVLYQFWSSGDRLPSTMLDVTRCSACTPTLQHAKQHAFQVIQSDGSPLLLAATDAEQAGRWMQALSAVLSTAVGRPSTRRPLPCRLLLLPHTLVLLHQTDLLLAAMSPASPPPPPPAPHPTPALPTHQLQTAMQYQIPIPSAPAVGPGGLILPSNATAAANGKADDTTGRRDSKSNLAPLLPAVGNLRNTRHLSSSLTSLNSTSSSTVASSTISNTNFPPQTKAPIVGAAAIPCQLSKPQVAPMTGVSSAMTASFSGPLPSATSTPNPPRSLALSSVLGDGVGRSLGGGMESGLRRQSASGSVRLPLNTRAAARVVARLDLRQLASVGRYNECSNTVMLEVSGSSSREISELGVAMSGPKPSTGDWALYFRGAKQLEHFLAALSVEAVVCERELCESSVQQFLLEGAQASAGGWAAVTTYAGGA